MAAQQQRLFLYHRGAAAEPTLPAGSSIVTLPHPATAAPVRMLLTPDRALEIQRFQREYGSWFVDDSVQSDGSLFLATPVDPLFLVLGSLHKHRNRRGDSDGFFCTTDQIFEDPDTPNLGLLLRYNIDLGLVCDQKELGDEPVYRLSDDKLLDWMLAKLETLTPAVGKLHDVTVVDRGVAAGFKTVDQSDEPDPENVRRYALGILLEYLPEFARTLLCAEFGLEPSQVYTNPMPVEPDSRKRKAPDAGDDAGALDDVAENKIHDFQAEARKIQSKKQAAAKQAAKIPGQRSIMGMFKMGGSKKTKK